MEVTLTSILTLNINSIKAHFKTNILQNLLNQLDIDIALLQEVAIVDLTLNGYNIISNVASNIGTAIAIRENIEHFNVIKTADQRGIAITVGNTKIINIYAPSGAQAKNQREVFYAETIAPLFDQPTENILIGGDFNCILAAEDALNHFNFCYSLNQLVQGLKLIDIWKYKKPDDPGYTFYRLNSASRLDRIYVSPKLKNEIISAQMVITEISDHNGIISRIRIGIRPFSPRGYIWKINQINSTFYLLIK